MKKQSNLEIATPIPIILDAPPDCSAQGLGHGKLVGHFLE